MFVRTPFNYDGDAVSLASGLVTPEPTRTKPEFADSANINDILRRFAIGQPPIAPVRAPTYGDFTMPVDYQGALNLVIEAGSEFQKLPSSVRERFGHNPAALLDFLQDEKNRPEAVSLGLIPKPPPENPPQS